METIRLDYFPFVEYRFEVVSDISVSEPLNEHRGGRENLDGKRKQTEDSSKNLYVKSFV